MSQTYTYEIGPVHSRDRKEAQENLVTGTVVATNYANATQKASDKAHALTLERGVEYGVIRIY